MNAGQLTRFLDKIEIQANNCVLWTANVNRNGYGLFWMEHGMRSAHRVAYEHFRGEIPAGLSLDHLCRTRHCVNYAHLEPVTHAENMRRSCIAQKTHCKHGHSLADAYICKHSQGRNGFRRMCRPCHLASAAKVEAAQKILRRERRERNPE